MGSTRRSFTPEYQKDAVALIVDGGHTIMEVAKKLDISETSIRKWVKKIQPPPTEPVPEKQLSESERAELARLRKENAKMEMQRRAGERGSEPLVTGGTGRWRTQLQDSEDGEGQDASAIKEEQHASAKYVVDKSESGQGEEHSQPQTHMGHDQMSASCSLRAFQSQLRRELRITVA
jgi:transposase